MNGHTLIPQAESHKRTAYGRLIKNNYPSINDPHTTEKVCRTARPADFLLFHAIPLSCTFRPYFSGRHRKIRAAIATKLKADALTSITLMPTASIIAPAK